MNQKKTITEKKLEELQNLSYEIDYVRDELKDLNDPELDKSQIMFKIGSLYSDLRQTQEKLDQIIESLT